MSRGVTLRFCVGDDAERPGRQCMRAATERVRPPGGYVEHLCPPCAIKWHEDEATRIRGFMRPDFRTKVREYWTVRDQEDRRSNIWLAPGPAREWMREASAYGQVWNLPLRLVRVKVFRKGAA